MLGTAHTSMSDPNAHIETADSMSATFVSRRLLKLRTVGVSPWNINLTGLASAYYSRLGPSIRMERTASPQIKFAAANSSMAMRIRRNRTWGQPVNLFFKVGTAAPTEQ